MYMLNIAKLIMHFTIMKVCASHTQTNYAFFFTRIQETKTQIHNPTSISKIHNYTHHENTSHSIFTKHILISDSNMLYQLHVYKTGLSINNLHQLHT